MDINIDLEDRYDKMPKQLDFILDDHFQTALYGGLGNGKTDAMCYKALLLALLYPTALGLIGRKTYPELKDSTIRSFFKVCPEELIATWDRNNHTLKLKNGAEIIFRAFDDPDKVKSINLGWFAIDQLEEISEDLYLTLLGRLRHPDCRYAIGVGNPEPGWVKRRFKDNNGKDSDLVLYEATTMENPHLPKNYVENLVKNYPKFWVDRYVYGRWENFEGQVFSEFHESENVIDPFDVPKAWRTVFFIDYGNRNPTAVLKFAIDYDDNYFIIDEHYEAGKIISYHADKIRQMGYVKGESMIYIDPSCNAKNREKNARIVSIVDEYMDEGIVPLLANNEIAGLLRANQFFKDKRLKIFRSCFNTIREVSELRWKKVKANFEGNLPETDEDKDNHTTDCIKYFANSRVNAPTKPKPENYQMLERENKLKKIGRYRSNGDWYNN